MKLILAPDSFKGSLSAIEICAHMKRAILRVFPDAEAVEIPVADGGEGTLDNVMAAPIGKGGRMRELTVRGPLGEPVSARYGILGDGETALVEVAQAAGLTLVPAERRNPLAASSYGVGELIADSLDQGCRRLVVGLGGSATNDGGAGLLRALGLRLLDAEGRELSGSAESLLELDRIDDSALDPRLQGVDVTVLCDVDNPLCGPNGASAVFGPQKGADPAAVALLDQALGRWADAVRSRRGIDLRELPGGGAAGGMGAALAGLLGGRLRSGIDWMIEAVALERHLEGADLLLTGEGRLDAQTLGGKVIAGLGRAAASRGVPVVAFCGSRMLPPGDGDAIGLTAAFAIAGGPCTLEEALARTPQWLEEQVENVCRLLRASQSLGRGQQ